jgi:kynurenine formamidase
MAIAVPGSVQSESFDKRGENGPMTELDIPSSMWGAGDEMGAANELNNVRLLEALQLVRKGDVFDLSQEISRTSPRDFDQSPYTICMWSNPLVSRRSFERDNAENGIGFAIERIEMDFHTGTHIDGLGHCSVGDFMFNRIKAFDAVGDFGLERLGIENLPPMVTRGILLDLPAFLKRDLEPGELITPDHLSSALRKQQVSIAPGSVVLVRTGWSRYYGSGHEKYVKTHPGIGVSAAEWFGQRQVCAVGADTMALEVVPSENPAMQFPVHQELLTKRGIYIIENAQLDKLAEKGVYEFLCLCLAPKFRGATAAPIRLVALV